MCAGGGARFAGVWEPGAGPSPRKDAIRSAFAATGKSFAAQTFAATSRLLDDYVGRWTTMYREACEATNVRGEQSAEVLDLRMSCLGARVENVRALTDVFAKADGDIVVNAVSAAGALPPLDGCADVEALRAVVKPPEDPATRKRVDELRDELARVTAIRDAGNCREAERRGTKLIEDVRATKYRPLLAQTLNVVAYLGNFCADPALSTTRSKQAYYEAVAGRDDETATVAASSATIYLANRLGRPDEARDWLAIAQASLARATTRKYLVGSVLTAQGTVLAIDHSVEPFIATTREAVARTSEAYGPDHYLVLAGLANIGDALSTVGRYDEAVAADEAALAAATRVLGAEHPMIASTSSNECEALNRAGRHAEALERCRRAMKIWAVDGADPVFRSYGLTGIGLALLGLGRPAEAIAPLEEAITARVAGHVAVPLQGESRFALARALWPRPAERPRALALARQARADVAGDGKAVAEIDAWLAQAR
ncbi:MAG TPA: tetratricopeptide repeat protein, partial [Polyangia bacterium]|nr:tetratricopeptide repeat protein [Polyangia bacterium]